MTLGDIKRMSLGGQQPVDGTPEYPLTMGEFIENRPRNSAGIKRDELLKLCEFIVSHVPVTKFYLKGGFVLGELTGYPRHTQDVDASVFDASSYTLIRGALAEYGYLLYTAGVLSYYEVKDRVFAQQSGGAEYYKVDGSLYLSVDISLASEHADSAVIAVNGLGSVRVNTIEQVMADKTRVLFSRKRFRRIKDLYDLYVCITKCKVNYDKVVSLLKSQAEWPFDREVFPFSQDKLESVEHAYDKYVLSDVDGNKIEKPAFRELLATLYPYAVKIMRESLGEDVL